MYESLNFCCGAAGRFGARLGGTNSSIALGNCSASGPEIDFPFTVGVRPDASDDEADEGEVSAPEDELIELMVFFIAPEAISFLGIDRLVPPESILEIGIGEVLESKDGLESASSLDLESCDDLGVVAFSVVSNLLGESIIGLLTEASLRGGADKPPPDVDRELSLISDCELLLEVPDFFPLGTSPNRNLSPVDGALPFALDDFGELACWVRTSSLPIAGEPFADEDLPPA